MHIFPLGEFDNKSEVGISLCEETNTYKFLLDLASYGSIGKGFVNAFRQKNKSKRKYFTNSILFEGFTAYIRRLAFEEIKYDLPKSFELYYYYYEYEKALLAYIINEIYFRETSVLEIEKLIGSDKILVEKEKFKERLTFDMGRAFFSMQGLCKIVDLKNTRRLRQDEFNLKLLQNMHKSILFLLMKI